MVRFLNGDIFTSEADCLVNPVNCVGTMGKGLALEFKRRYKGLFPFYQNLCDTGTLRIGNVAIWQDDKSTRDICLFPTKGHYRYPSKLEYISEGLDSFLRVAINYNINSVAFPKLGCGEGGLNFDHHVKPLLISKLDDTYLDVTVYV